MDRARRTVRYACQGQSVEMLKKRNHMNYGTAKS